MLLGLTAAAVISARAEISLSERRSGYTDLAPDSKAMQDGSWSWSTWGEENFPKTTGKPRYLTDKRTCVLPVELQPGRTYAIWLNSNNFGNFKDAEGRQAVPYLLIFETKK